MQNLTLIYFRQLISQIELFKQTNVQAFPSSEAKKTGESAEPGVLKYQMMYLPEKARMQEAARIAQLEQRLCSLENFIGTSNDNFSKFSQVRLYIISQSPRAFAFSNFNFAINPLSHST